MTMQIAAKPATQGWLYSAHFDHAFILGIAMLALLSGAAVVANPNLFPVVLLLDLWLLGYHHVISTFTRLCFDKQSFRENRFLLIPLPILVFAATFLIAYFAGLWALGTIYLYWQWFHYTRQSWGIAQAYRRKTQGIGDDPLWLSQGVMYALPVWGILYRSWQQPVQFIGLDVWTAPVPGLAVDLSGIVALALIGIWGVRRIILWQQGVLPVAHTLYVLSHLSIFAAGYLLIADITYGWLVINMWHNLQYVMFVWMFNNRRYNKGIESQTRFLSLLSQTRNWPYYFMVCLGLSSVIYLGINQATPYLLILGIPAIVIYQAVNFHHYIVDGLIWKRRHLAKSSSAASGAS